jgi:hypothetical protein
VITLLKEVSTITLPAMHPAGVLAAQALHEPPYRHVSHLQSQVNSIDFPTKRVYASPAARQHGRQELLEDRVIGGVGENRLTSVATLDDVVNAARYMKSGST